MFPHCIIMENNKIKGEVIHIVSPEKAVNYKWEEKASFLPEGLQIVSIDDIRNLPVEVRHNLFGYHNIKLNDVFMLNPYSGNYVLVTEADQNYKENKFAKISEVVSLLGAKQIQCEIISEETRKREFNADGNVNYKVVKVSASMQEKSEDKVLERILRKRTFPGTSTLDGYFQAKVICESTGLINELGSLLSLRNPSHPNPIKSDYYEVEITRELNSGLDLAFNLNVLKNVFALNAEVQEAISTSKSIKLKMYIEF